MRILLVASEVVGFAKTGGLADVCGSLPVALARRGHEVAVLMPLYRSARGAHMTPSPTDRVFCCAGSSIGKQKSEPMIGTRWRAARS